MDEKWVREMAGRIKKDLAGKKAKDEKFVETQKLKRELGPGVWNELRDWLKGACKDPNIEMGTEIARFAVVDGNKVSVTGMGDGMHTTMYAKFVPDQSLVEYDSQSGEPARKYEVVINSDGSAALGERGMSFGLKPADIGKEIMSHALRVFPY